MILSIFYPSASAFCLKALLSLEWKLCLMCSNKKILQLKKWAIKSRESFNEACKISCMKSISLAYNRTRKFFLHIWITIWHRQQQHNNRRRKILISSWAINCATKKNCKRYVCKVMKINACRIRICSCYILTTQNMRQSSSTFSFAIFPYIFSLFNYNEYVGDDLWGVKFYLWRIYL